MADKKISDLTTASEIKNEDNIELSQSTGGGLVSLKATILALATKIVTNINFTSALNTTSKTITGAINEVAQGGGGGSSTLAGLTDVDIDDQTLADGQILAFNGTSEKWENGAGGGGTTVVANPTGTATADLETIQIGNVIYDIPGSGGGGSGYTASLVYDGSSQSTLQTSIELTEDYDKFDALYFFIKFAGDGSTFEGLLLKEQIDYGLTNSKIIGFAAFASVYAGGKMSSDKKTFTNIYGGGNIQNIVAVYGLKFGTGGSSGGGIDYSTTEQDTGLKWVNGETIYQKTIYYAGGVSGTVSFAHGISNFGIPLYAEGICFDTYQSGYYITMPRIDNNGYNIGIMAIDSTNIQYFVPSAFSNRITDVYVTLRYTKSSS